MAGHSKWKNIRIRKGKQDALRGKLFTKLSREIIVAAKAGGGDPNMNARLRVAVDKAKESSVPAENIKRAIDRGTGAIEGAAYEELTYEGKGPGGSALILKCYTENRNRTVADLRNAFNKNGGQMAENGAVAWQFKYVGQIIVPKANDKGEGVDEDALTMAALEAGAEDVTSDDETITVETAMGDLHGVNSALKDVGFAADDVLLTYVPTMKAELTLDDQRKLLRLMDALDELDDVQDTYINTDFADEIMDEE